MIGRNAGGGGPAGRRSFADSVPPRRPGGRASRRPRTGNGAAGSILDRYFKEIRRFPVLTRQEEVALVRAAQAGDERAMNRLVECNLRFVAKVAGQYRNLGLPYEDLVNEGNIGLIEAARRFDPERGTKFIGWAAWWVRKAICTALSEQTQVVRLPTSQLKKMRAVRATERALIEKLGREPSSAELSEKLPGDGAMVDPIHRHGIRLSSLDEPIGDLGRQTVAATLVDASIPSAERQIIDREAAHRVSSVYSMLSDQQKLVISRRFGFDGGTPGTLAEIGDQIGLSREGVRLIERRAVERLRRLVETAATPAA